MGMRFRRFLLAVLVLCCLLLLCGCRTRTSGIGQGKERENTASEPQGNPAQEKKGAAASSSAESGEKPDAEENGEPGGPTRENPDADRKEYDENGRAEVAPGTRHLLHEEGEGTGAPVPDNMAETSAHQKNDLAEETALQTVAADEADAMGVAEEGEEAESALTYFTVLLQDRTGSTFECQRLNAYWETEEDHVTVHKTSPEHTLILSAGCYDVSSRLLPENLQVDDGWIARKNPGVIIKIVDSRVLGSRVSSEGAAESVYQQLLRRDGWQAVDAVKNSRILLLSRELLESPYLQTAAAVIIAKTANPALFSDVNLKEMLQMLGEEATGMLPSGIYYYSRQEGLP